MKTYEYKILRYCHDKITGEFVNVGILLFSAEDRILLLKTIERSQRLNDFFPGLHGKNIKTLLTRMCGLTEKIEEKIFEQLDFDSYNDIEKISSLVLPQDDSALLFTNTFAGLTLDIKLQADKLYENIVGKYDKNTDRKSFSDDDVWKNIYKKYFDSKGITQNLTKETFQTKNDSMNFNFCWKNEKWHIYQPISFDFDDISRIKNKVYQHNGLLNELLTSESEICLNYMTMKPIIQYPDDIQRFLEEKLTIHSHSLESKVVFEENADSFTSEIQLQLEHHSA